MDDVTQMEKIVPFITCENSFGQSVCELMFGVNVTDLTLGVQVNPVKQPSQSNSVGLRHMPHCGASDSDCHLNHGLIVLKDVQHSTGTRLYSV